MTFITKRISSKLASTKANINNNHPKLSGVMSTMSTVGLMVAIGGSATLAAIAIGWSCKTLSKTMKKSSNVR